MTCRSGSPPKVPVSRRSGSLQIVAQHAIRREMGVMSDRQSAPTWLRAYLRGHCLGQRVLLDWPNFLEQAPQRNARTAIPMRYPNAFIFAGRYAARCIVSAEDPSNHEQEATHAP